MKKILICLSLLILSGCFWSSESTDSGLILKDGEDFSILLPTNWKELPSQDLPIPKSGEVVLSYSSPGEKQGYINNIVILEAKNAQEESSLSLMNNAASFLEENLNSYKLLKKENLTFIDEEVGGLIVYTGKYNVSTPEVTYVQTARSCGEESYFLTISVAEKLENYEKYEYLLSSFQCS